MVYATATTGEALPTGSETASTGELTMTGETDMTDRGADEAGPAGEVGETD